MHHTSTAPSGVRHLTVHTGARGVDMVLSAQSRVESLLPVIVDALGIEPGPVAVEFQLHTPSGAALDPSQTLGESGIRDGTTLSLVRSSTEWAALHCDDPAEAVSVAVTDIEQGWTQLTLRCVGTLLAIGSAGVAAVLLVRVGTDVDDAHHPGCVGIAAALSVLAILAAAGAYRIARAPGAGLALGVIAIVFAAISGLFAVPDGLGAPNALLAAAAAASCAVLLRVIAGQAIIFTAVACFAVTCVATAALSVLVGAPLPAMGAGLAAVSLAVIEASPAAVVIFTRLSAHQTRDALPAEPIQWRLRAIRAHRWLAGFMSAFSTSAALGAVGTLFGASAPRLVFAGVVGVLLLLRSRAHRDVSRSLPPLISGAVTLDAVLVAVGVACPEYAVHVAALSMMLGFVAVYAGFLGQPATPSPAWRRTVEVAEYLGFATVVPLTLWLCGLLTAARAANLW